MLHSQTSRRPVVSPLLRLFNPKVVAIVGVSDDESKYSGRLLRYCRDIGMSSNLRLVNPKYEQIAGLPCWRSLDALPEVPDVVVAMVGPDRIPDLFERCNGVGFMVVVGELVRREIPERIRHIDRLVKAANDGGMRIVGPDCVGVLSPANAVSMSISSALLAGPALNGNVGLISQSGGIIASVIDRARDAHFGFSHIVSGGGEVDLDVCDYLEFMIDDPATAAISIYAEAFKDAQRFLALARIAQARSKPIVLLKPGRSDAGASAALSHSGRMAGHRDVQSAFFRRTGIIEADDIDDLWATAAFLGQYRSGMDGGVGAVSLSGGYTAVVGDALAASAVRLAELSLATVERIKAEVAQPRPANPVDAMARPTPGRETDDVVACLDAFEDDPRVGATLYAETLFLGVEKIIPKLAAVASRNRKPHVTCWQAGGSIRTVIAALRQQGVFALTDLGQATRALKALQTYSAFQGPDLSETATATWSPEWISTLEAGTLSDDDVRKLLKAYSVPFVTERVVQDGAAAAAAGSELEFPVVLKGIVPGCLHKTEKGLVRVGLADPDAVHRQAAEMAARVPDLCGFQVQKMMKGLELIIGVNSDPDYGAAILLGFGGIFAEAMDRKAIEAIPISERLAEDMIDRIDGRGLLSGYRTGVKMDREALVRLLCGVSRLVHAHRDRISEIDLNPVIVTESGCVTVDAIIILK